MQRWPLIIWGDNSENSEFGRCTQAMTASARQETAGRRRSVGDAGGRRQAQRQPRQRADREIGEGLRLERVAVPADRLDRAHGSRRAGGAVPPSAPGLCRPPPRDQPFARRRREMAARCRDRRRRHLGQGRGAVLHREPCRQRNPGNRRGRAISAGVGRNTGAARNRATWPARHARRERARRRNRPPRRCAAAPNRRSAHCRARCRRRGSASSVADPGHIGDAADIEHGERLRQSLPRGRHETAGPAARPRRPPRHRPSGNRRRRRCRAAAPAARRRRSARCGASVRAMQDRVAVKPDQVDRALGWRARNRSTAAACSRVSSASTSATGPAPPSTDAQPFAKLLRIGDRQRGPGDHASRRRRSRSWRHRSPSSEVPLISPNARHTRAGVLWPGARAPMLEDAAMPIPRSPFSPPRSNAASSINAPTSSALDARLPAGRVVAYVGYDCTADSLHVGSLVSIMLLRLLQQSGHKPIVLMGGGTTRIGDPSGKDEARPLLDDAEIARNMAGIRTVFAKFLKFGDGAERRGDGQQRRLARRAALHPAAARYRAAFLGQPHADPGQRPAAARARAAADAFSNSTT